MEVMRDRAAVVMATRIEQEVYSLLKEKVPDVEYFATARICALGKQRSENRSRTILNLEFKIQNSKFRIIELPV